MSEPNSCCDIWKKNINYETKLGPDSSPSSWPHLAQIITPHCICIYFLYIYIYIYAVRLLSRPSLASLSVIIWANVLTLLLQNTMNIVVSAQFICRKEGLRAQILKCYYLGQVGHFSCCNKLGPDNDTYLARKITSKNGSYLPFFAFRNVLKYLFYSVF